MQAFKLIFYNFGIERASATDQRKRSFRREVHRVFSDDVGILWLLLIKPALRLPRCSPLRNDNEA